MPFIREDMADIRVSVADPAGVFVPLGDSWYSAEGAGLEADSSKTRGGGMGPEVSLGGPASRDDCTVTIQLSDVVLGWHSILERRVQEDAPVKVGYQFLNRLKQPYGITHTVTGTLKSAVLPDMDTGGNEASFYTLVIDCDENAA